MKQSIKTRTIARPHVLRLDLTARLALTQNTSVAPPTIFVSILTWSVTDTLSVQELRMKTWRGVMRRDFATK